MAIDGIKGIKDDDLVKKLNDHYKAMGIKPVSINPTPEQGVNGVDPNSWAGKYGNATVFDIKPDSTPRQTMVAQAASSAPPPTVTDASPNPMNTSIWTQGTDFNNPNIQPGGAVGNSPVPVATPTALTQPNGAERGGTDNAASQQSKGKPRFDAKALFEMTNGGLSTTIKTPSAAVGPNDTSGPNTAKGPNDTKGPNVVSDNTPGPNDTAGPNNSPGANNVPEGPNDTKADKTIEDQKPPETEVEINKKEEKTIENKKEEETRRTLEKLRQENEAVA